MAPNNGESKEAKTNNGGDGYGRFLKEITAVNAVVTILVAAITFLLKLPLEFQPFIVVIFAGIITIAMRHLRSMQERPIIHLFTLWTIFSMVTFVFYFFVAMIIVKPITVTGILAEVGSEEPNSGTGVMLIDGSGVEHTSTTDDNGRFTFSDILPGGSTWVCVIIEEKSNPTCEYMFDIPRGTERFWFVFSNHIEDIQTIFTKYTNPEDTVALEGSG